MPDKTQKLQWLEAAKAMGLRFVVVVMTKNKEIDEFDRVHYCTDVTGVKDCFKRISNSNRTGTTTKCKPAEILDVEMPWDDQVRREYWSPLVKGR